MCLSLMSTPCKTVDFLDLVDEVGGQRLHALDRQNVVRRRIAVEDVVALFDVVAILKVERLALRDEILDGLDAIFRRLDLDAALVLVVATEADGAIDLGDDGVILRTARLEQFRHPRQTTGDVLGLGAFERHTCENVALADLGARFDRQDRVDRELEAGFAATGQLGDFAILALDHDRRLEIGAARGRTPVDDLTLGDAGCLVGGFGDRDAVDHVFEFHDAFDFGHHRAGVGIPLGQTLAAFDRIAVVDIDLGTVATRCEERSVPFSSRIWTPSNGPWQSDCHRSCAACCGS
jgi:hypothetical protein